MTYHERTLASIAKNAERRGLKDLDAVVASIEAKVGKLAELSDRQLRRVNINLSQMLDELAGR